MAAGIVFVIKPTGTVVAVVWAEATGEKSPARDIATAAAMERVQMDDVVLEGKRFTVLWFF